MGHNWKFETSQITMADGSSLLLKRNEGSITKPIADAGEIDSKIVAVGVATDPLSDELTRAVKGHIALIDRGGSSFCKKLENAVKAEAVGAIIANNKDESFGLGGDCKIEIPAIAISKSEGDKIKASLVDGDVNIDFKSTELLEEPELVDTLTSFSSRGPRSYDSAIKPEIAGPGYNIISAEMGKGNKTVQMSGTSMSAPHIAGVAALVKHSRKELSTKIIKSMIVNTAASISDKDGKTYPVAMQGAGKVQTFEAVTSTLAIVPATMSLGEVLVAKEKTTKKSFTLKNISDSDVTVELKFQGHSNITVSMPTTVIIEAGSEQSVEAKIVMQPIFTNDETSVELDGNIIISGSNSTLRLPVLAVARRSSEIVITDESSVELTNEGATQGLALPFNLIGIDDRKDIAIANESRNTTCDLESAGYRIVTQKSKDEETGEEVEIKIIQFGIKIFNPVTTWDLCDVSIMLDNNDDGTADQEISAYYSSKSGKFSTLVYDAKKMRDIRAKFEKDWTPDSENADYQPAFQDGRYGTTFAHSTIAILNVSMDKLVKASGDKLKIKILTVGEYDSPDRDDYLGNQKTTWKTISANAVDQSYKDLPNVVSIVAGSSESIPFTKGNGSDAMILYLPHNGSNFSGSETDLQSLIITP
jgi:minor extracellular serine protease Vpr